MTRSWIIGRVLSSRRLSRYRTQFPHSTCRFRHKQYSTEKQQPAAESADLSKSTAAKSIPGPVWLWSEPLNSYTRMHSRRPHTVQLVSTLIIYLIGDLTAQSLAPTPQEDDEDGNGKKVVPYDPYRTMRALLIGGLAAVPGYHWFLFLARNFNYTSKTFSIGLKVMINQILFTPIFNTYFFGMQSLLTGADWNDIVERVKHTVPRSWLNSWKLWPAVTAFSFAFIRIELRGLFAGVIAIGWQTYLSILNQRAAKLEKAAKESDGDTHRTKKLQHA
jgi:protein Mpv17